MALVERTVHLTVGAHEALSYFVDAQPLATIMAADHAEVEAREGGPFELFWHSGDSTKGCKITHFADGQALTAEFSAPQAHARLGPDADGTISVNVRADGGGSVVQVVHDLHDGVPDGEAQKYFEQRWDEWAHNLQVLAFSDKGVTGAAGRQRRFDLSAVELSQIPHRRFVETANVADQA